MVAVDIEAGSTIDGFRVGEQLHRGGMATLWSVMRSDLDGPMLMKVPSIGERSDPAAIVSFEMEQMILPRLVGLHAPRLVAAGSLEKQPYVVMEQISGTTLLKRLPDLPLSYADVAAIGRKIAVALAALHGQHVVHHDIKPSNIMFRETGEAVLLDFGLAYHDQLPDLLQEEFRLPYGTAPYMAPERLRGVRNDPRSDIFSLGVLMYFFATGTRPFGEGETLRSMRRRLWRDPHPPRRLRPDCPLWLQEIILRCLEIEPAWRYGSAAQLAFDLDHADQVRLTARAEKLKRDSFAIVLRRRFNRELTTPRPREPISAQLAAAPIILVAIDLERESRRTNDELLALTRRLLATMPDARVACLNVLKLNRIALDMTLDEEGRNKHVERLAALRHWAEPLGVTESGKLTTHVVEALGVAGSILEFAGNNRVSHVVIGARQTSLKRSLLGSVSAEVASAATCTVTVVRPTEIVTPAAWPAQK
jgi:serine/threonine protein kinase